MTSTSPLQSSTPPHVLELLAQLHKISKEQEATITPGLPHFVSIQTQDAPAKALEYADPNFDKIMLDKFIALDEDKCHFVYQLILSTGATNVVEAGTSFGVSTIYLALAVAKTKAAYDKDGKVIATEKEEYKAEKAKGYWKKCGSIVEDQIDLRVGDLLETLKKDVPIVDLLLLDIWSPLALPTLKTVKPKFRRGTVVLADNTSSGAKGYDNYMAYIRDPTNGFRTMTLPFEGGFEMSVHDA